MYPPLFLSPHSPLPLSSPLFSSPRLSLPFSILLHPLLLLLSSPPLLYSLLPSPPHSSSSSLSLSSPPPPLFLLLLLTLLNIRCSSFLLPYSSPSQFSSMFLLFPSCSSFSSCSSPLKFFLPRLLSFSLLLFLLSLRVLPSFCFIPSSFLRFLLLPPSPPSISFPSFLLHILLFFYSPPSPAFLFASFTSPLFPSAISSAFSFIPLHFPSYNQAFSFIRRSRITVRENWYLERILVCLPIMHCSPPFRHYYIRRTKLHIMFYCQRR